MSIYNTYRSMDDKPFYSKKGQVIKQKPIEIAPKIEKSMISPARSFLMTKDKYYIGPNEDPGSVDVPYYTLNEVYQSHIWNINNINVTSPESEVIINLSNIVTDGAKDLLLSEHLDVVERGYKFSLCTVNINSFYADYGNIPSQGNMYLYALNHSNEYHFSNVTNSSQRFKLEGVLNVGQDSAVTTFVTADIGAQENSLYYPASEGLQGFVTCQIDDVLVFEKLIRDEALYDIQLIKFQTDYDIGPEFYFSVSIHVRYLLPSSYRPTINI